MVDKICESIATMKRLVLVTAALLALALLLATRVPATDAHSAAVPAAAQPSAPAAITATVQVGPASAPISFEPGTQVVDLNDSVHWVWNSPLTPHSVTSGMCSGIICTPDSKFDSGAPQTAPGSFDFTFNTPGIYPYFCKVHLSSMTGAIFVASTRVYLPLVVR